MSFNTFMEGLLTDTRSFGFVPHFSGTFDPIGSLVKTLECRPAAGLITRTLSQPWQHTSPHPPVVVVQLTQTCSLGSDVPIQCWLVSRVFVEQGGLGTPASGPVKRGSIILKWSQTRDSVDSSIQRLA